MSEEAELIAEELKWLIRCNLNRYIIRGKVLSYEAIYTKLEDGKYTYRWLWYSVALPQPFGPSDTVYYSPALAGEVEHFIRPSKIRQEVLPW